MGGGNYSWFMDADAESASEPKRPEEPRAVSYPSSLRDTVRRGLSQPDPMSFEIRELLVHDLETPNRTFESPEGGPWVVTQQVATSARGIIILDRDSMQRRYQPQEVTGLARTARDKGGDVTVFARAGAVVPECLASYRVERFTTDDELAKALDEETKRHVGMGEMPGWEAEE